MIADRSRVSFRGNKTFKIKVIEMVEQLCEYTKKVHALTELQF